MNRFYGREEELRKLNRRYAGDQFECLVIYGRRRVGKTALISEFCKDKPTVFFSALNATAQENLKVLSRAINAFERPDCPSSAAFPDYDAAFEEIASLAEGRRLVVVIDEYPCLAKAFPAVSAMLQHLIDHKWSETRFFLILCGSSMSFMERQVLGKESPLYGRRTGQFRIEPMDYRTAALFHPGLSCEDNALIYGITGGVPHYIRKLGVQESVDEALLENVFDRSGSLFEEPENLLRRELREPAVYSAIIGAMAEGASRLNEIAARTGEQSMTVANYMKKLIGLRLVKRETPAAEKPGRKSVYLLADNFFRFWYRFVPKNMSAIASGRISRSYAQAIRAFFPDYMGLVFEQMCREYLLLYAEDLPIALNEAGQWWGTDPVLKKEVQIDIVGTSSAGREFLFGSCKYMNEKVGLDELELLRRYASVFGKGDRRHYVIFSKSGFTESLLEAGSRGEVRLVTLEDMYR